MVRRGPERRAKPPSSLGRYPSTKSSYSYEDFVEGYRPREDGGFALRSGPLRTIAAQAAGDPDHNYGPVVDELNRGNVSECSESSTSCLSTGRSSPGSCTPTHRSH